MPCHAAAIFTAAAIFGCTEAARVVVVNTISEFKQAMDPTILDERHVHIAAHLDLRVGHALDSAQAGNTSNALFNPGLFLHSLTVCNYQLSAWLLVCALTLLDKLASQ